MEKGKSLKSSVMEVIQNGDVRMRPRWHFLLFSSFALVGIAIVVLTLLYASSLVVFLLRDSGVWFLLSFGSRGWQAFFYAFPWLLLSLVVVFVVLLELLVQRYSFVYKKPILFSILGIVVSISIGGYALAQTSMHRSMAWYAEKDLLPPPMKLIYRGPFRTARPSDVYRGTIVATSTGGFLVRDIENGAEATVLVTEHTRLPYGGDFAPGSAIVILGDPVATATIRAFGVRSIVE